MGSKNRLRLSQKASTKQLEAQMVGNFGDHEWHMSIYTKRTPYIMCNRGIDGLQPFCYNLVNCKHICHHTSSNDIKRLPLCIDNINQINLNCNSKFRSISTRVLLQPYSFLSTFTEPKQSKSIFLGVIFLDIPSFPPNQTHLCGIFKKVA